MDLSFSSVMNNNNNPKNKHNNNFDTIDSSGNGNGFTQTRIIKPLTTTKIKTSNSGGASNNMNRQAVPMS